VAVAHPSYSGGRGQEDCGLKLAWANYSQDPMMKKRFTKKKKRVLVEWLKVKVLSLSTSTKKINKIKTSKQGKTEAKDQGDFRGLIVK
jgi:hypothetical protein